jgi:DNA-binding transcriptional ArsR family regulator
MAYLWDVSNASGLSRTSSISNCGAVARQTPGCGEIVKKLKLNQPQVSKHLKVLSLAGLVEAQTFAQLRVYQLRLQPLKELDHWLKLI